MANPLGFKALAAFLFPERGAVLARPYAIVAVAGAAIGILLATSDLGSRLEWALYDRFSRGIASSAAPTSDVVVIAIDEPSFAEIALPWPWPRTLHASLIDQLVQAGARTIAFDIVFDVASTPLADAELAAAMGRAGNVVLASAQSVTDDRAYAIEQSSQPIEPFARVAAAVGSTRMPLEPDAVVRRAWLHYAGQPTLALTIASRDLHRHLPTVADTGSPTLFRFRGPSRRGVTTVSYYQALDAANQLPRDFFRGKHVLIGRALEAPAADDADVFETPVAVRMPGVEIHATLVDAVLRSGFIIEPFASVSLVSMWCGALAAVMAAGLFWLGPAGGVAATSIAMVLLVTSGYVLLGRNIHVPVVAPIVSIAAAYAATASYRFALVTRERRIVRRAFQHYVSPAIVEKMLNDPSQLKLGGEEYEISVLFSDLEGFTTLAERVTPSALTQHLGQYFQEMLDVLLPHHGTLDKLIGDSIMMYFGCPIPDQAHAINACRGALAMQQRMAALNERWSRMGLPPLRTRIGINSGMAVAGNMGTTSIFNFTVIGDCVNLASRLEGANKEYGTLIIVGQHTWDRVHHAFEGRELDAIRVKGKTQAVTIYELAAEKGLLDARRQQLFDHFGAGLRFYRDQQWTEAVRELTRGLEIDPRDGPSQTLLRRCERYQRQGPTVWDSVHSL